MGCRIPARDSGYKNQYIMIVGYEFNTIISFSQPCNFTVYMATIDHMPPASITETPNRCNDLMMVNHMMINVKPNFTIKSYLSLSCEWCTALTYIRPFSIFTFGSDYGLNWRPILEPSLPFGVNWILMNKLQWISKCIWKCNLQNEVHFRP